MRIRRVCPVKGRTRSTNKRMRRFLCIFLIVLASGCRPVPQDEVTLVWATNSHASRMDAVRWFEREHPGIKVRIMPISQPRQFFLQCIWGDAPDVITFFSPDTFQTFARNGLLRPLGYSFGPNWPYYTALKDYCFKLGTEVPMALPQVAYPYVLYFNPDLVSTAEALAVHNWDDLLALIRKTGIGQTKAGNSVFGLDIHNDFIWFTTWYWQRGGRLFSKKGESVLDPTIARETLDAMVQWRSIPGLLPHPSDRLNLPSKGASQGVLGSLFLQGRAMFYWSGSWKISDFKNQNKVGWQVRCLPGGPANALTVMGGNSFGVSSRTRHPEFAEAFVTYLSGPKGQKRHMNHHIYLPARKELKLPVRMEVLKNQARLARCLETSPLANEAVVKEAFEFGLESLRLGKTNADETAVFLSRALTAATQRGGQP